jgi:hypothetical protein
MLKTYIKIVSMVPHISGLEVVSHLFKEDEL